MRDLRIALSLAVVGAQALALACTAAADPGKSPLPAAPAAAVPSPKTPSAGDLGMLGRRPRGYVQVTSGAFTALAGHQTRGTVACPAGTVPLAGGEVVTSFDLHANVNSSFPQAGGWAVDVNNGSGADTTFTVYATCAQQPRQYQVVETSQTVAASSQSTLDANCPSGTVVLGGGALSYSSSLDSNINGTYPEGSWAWRTDSNNATAGPVSVHVFAICGSSPYGYRTVGSATVANPSGSESSASATCPGKAVPLGGGGISYTGQTSVNLNTSRPDAHGWRTYENNASPVDAFLQVALVCAGG
jgi:hypothetical protein